MGPSSIKAPVRIAAQLLSSGGQWSYSQFHRCKKGTNFPARPLGRGAPIVSNPFFDHPILNSPRRCPMRHWELDADGQPTQNRSLRSPRRQVHYPDPEAEEAKAPPHKGIWFDEGKGLSTMDQQYDPTSIINEVRGYVDAWRSLPPNQWQVTPETARLLQHWRHHEFSDPSVLLPGGGGGDRDLADRGRAAVQAREATAGPADGVKRRRQPGLMRIALKMATGSGKTTVMAMIIAWQTINAVRRSASKYFTRGFLSLRAWLDDQRPVTRPPAQRSR